VTDLDNYRESHVNAEGTIVNNSNAKATAAALGLTTGSAVVAGAMIGGGVGAVVGLGVGAGAGAVWWLRRDRQQTLPKGTEIVFMLDNSMQLGGS
jgi:outer membrane lipoprotein SlyB